MTPQTTATTLSNNLRYLRVSVWCSQQKFANKIKRPIKRYQKWEEGRSRPNVDDIIAIASAHKISIDELLTQDLCARKPVKVRPA